MDLDRAILSHDGINGMHTYNKARTRLSHNFGKSTNTLFFDGHAGVFSFFLSRINQDISTTSRIICRASLK